MTREEGLMQIDMAEWQMDKTTAYLKMTVTDANDQPVECWLHRRPPYCDRGHIGLQVFVKQIGLDDADSFPRYFFSFEEADRHTRTFLKWRLWKERTVPASSTETYWRNPALRETMCKVWNTGERAERLVR